jgi:hypothetical protein
MKLLYLVPFFWIVVPFVVALFNFIAIGILHVTNAKRITSFQPIKLITYDFSVATGALIISYVIGFVVKAVTGLNDLPLLIIVAVIALFINLIYLIKLRDNIWFKLIRDEPIRVNDAIIKVTKMPILFSFLIPSANKDISIYVSRSGLIVDENFYSNASEILKKYVSYLAKAFNKSAISTRLFSHLLISQIGLIATLITSNWISNNISVNAVVDSGFSFVELQIIAAFFVSLVTTVYSLNMVSSLYKWQWTFAEQNLSEVFSEVEIKHINNELKLHNVKVNGYYNIIKWKGYTPKPT